MATLTFNALALRPDGTGVQTYIAEVLAALRRATTARMDAVVQADAADLLPTGVGAVTRRPCDGIRRAVVGLLPPPTTDLIHGLDVDLPFASAPKVATVHDLSVFDVPWSFGPIRSRGERAILRQALGRADAVIAVSTFTAERLRHHLGIEATVVLEGAPPARPAPDPDALVAFRRRRGLPDRFVVHVGSLDPRKDVPTLAAACRRAGLALVLAGPGTVDAAPGLGALGLGYVSAQDLPLLYAAASVVGYPSRYEGFGLPPLEAMAAGAPVVASDATSLPEVLGGGAVLVPVGDVEAWADALATLAADDALRAERVRAGRARIEDLSWDATASGTLAVYRLLGLDV